MEDDIGRFEVIVDHLGLLLAQVLQPAYNLLNNDLCLLLVEALVDFEVIAQIWAITFLKNSKKGMGGHLNGIVLVDNIRVLEGLVNLQNQSI